MQAVRNRVVEGMEGWLKREHNMAQLFSPHTLRTRHFQKLKLDYLRELNRTLRKDASRDERMTLRILRGEMKDMERWLYQHPLERLLRRIGRAIKNLLSPRPKVIIAERTNWMMKVSHSNVEKPQKTISKENTLRPEQIYKQKNQKPELLEKKRVSQKKGLRM